MAARMRFSSASEPGPSYRPHTDRIQPALPPIAQLGCIRRIPKDHIWDNPALDLLPKLLRQVCS